MKKIEYTEILNGLELEDLEAPDDAMILDAFVILRVQHMEGSTHPHLYYTNSKGFDDQNSIGALIQITDLIRHKAIQGWEADD